MSRDQHPLRIAIIRQRYTPFGGAERFVERALNALKAHTDIELSLITRKWKGAESTTIRKILCKPLHIGRLWRDWSFSRCACRQASKGNFDLVQSHERVLCGDIYRAGDGVHRQWLMQRKRVLPSWKWWFVRINPYHRYLLAQERRMFTQPELKTVIVNSEMVRKEILHHIPEVNAEIVTIHNAVDHQRFNPRLRQQHRSAIREQLGIADETPLILFVGSGFERKGVPLLLKILPAIAQAHLVIIGKDRKTAQYRRQLAGSGAEERVHFLGPIEEVAPYLGAADLFAFPTLYDPLPNTVLEAMASGLPVVISNSCGATDLVEDGVSGLICDPLDESAWQQAIHHLLDRKISIDMGEKAHQQTLGLTEEHMTAQLVQIYNRLLYGQDNSASNTESP